MRRGKVDGHRHRPEIKMKLRIKAEAERERERHDAWKAPEMAVNGGQESSSGLDSPRKRRVHSKNCWIETRWPTGIPRSWKWNFGAYQRLLWWVADRLISSTWSYPAGVVHSLVSRDHHRGFWSWGPSATPCRALFPGRISIRTCGRSWPKSR